MQEGHVRNTIRLAAVGVAVLGALASVQTQSKQRLNPVIGLLEQNKPVFGLYAPSNRRGGPPGAQAQQPAPPQRTAAELAREAVAFKTTDFLFDGSMEGGMDRALPAFTEFVNGWKEAGPVARTPFVRLTHPLVVKMHEIAPDPAKAAASISTQLNLGVSGIMFVSAESAAEVKAGLDAMRFKAKGGTRPEAVGNAPSLWGMSEVDYRRKADLWPLNPDGELINWTIIESKEGLAQAREIAAVKGIGVLWPGAGTLRGLFSTTDANGQRKLDEAAWENAIQTVLSACKEFKVACGYPASPNDIEMRMKQGFSVFVMNWGDAGFKAIDIGRKASNRSDTSR
jgi:2-keto-3-deoxy-L-rhamnonate aldolase RhmA